MSDLLSVMTGLCAGIVSGSALCAFYVALGVFSKSAISLGLNSVGIWMAIFNTAGCVLGTIITLFNAHIQVNDFWSGVWGLFAGIYAGFFIACLSEVTNIIPVLKKYAVLKVYIVSILIAFVAGKLIGSMIYWISGGF
ncbi:MAG: stage V sporulation protein AB [Christensenellales bacterium]|jgi:stage V sporulation protein AB